MVEFQEVADQQKLIGDTIQAVLRRLKKDPYDRKREASYLQKASGELEDAWRVFLTNHQAIEPLLEVNQQHPYARNDFFSAIREIYRKAKDYIAALNKPPASANVKEFQPQPFRVFDDACSDDNTSPHNVIHLQKLVRKQKAAIKDVQYFIQNLHERTDEQHPKQYYTVNIQMLDNYNKQLTQNNQAIWENSTDEEGLAGYELQEYQDTKITIRNSIVQLQQHLSNGIEGASKVVDPQSEVLSAVKLPQITLPFFDGDYLKWTQFKELYTQLIHNQPISNTQKMYYLINNLNGEAKRLIQHLPVSDENYRDAWRLLNSRYDNKRILVTSLLNKLLSQSFCQGDSATSIKAFHDTTNESLLGLKNMGIATETWDPILLYLLRKRLDRDTLALYEQTIESPREMSTVQHFLIFLEQRFQSLEALGSKKPTPFTSKFSKTTALIIAPAEDQCPVCSQIHLLHNCKSFLKQSVKDRIGTAKKYKLCLNCLKPSHMASQCTSRCCKRCPKRHHTSLHLEETSRSPTTQITRTQPVSGDDTQSATKQIKGATTLVAQLNKASNKYVLLGTIRLKVRTCDGHEVECRAVLDSGSQLNFITKGLATRLGLASTSEALRIQGIGQSKQLTQAKVNIAIKSKTTGFETRIEAFVLPKIINHQPAHLIDVSNWPIPSNLRLADPEFNKPEAIEMLIGAELYFQLLSIGQISLGDNLPTLQNTVFGWVACGKVTNEAVTEVTSGICSMCSNEDSLMDNRVTKFWQLEDVSPQSCLTVHEKKCEEHFARTTKRDLEGRFIVSLPFAQDPSLLGESKDIAVHRFLSLERKLGKDESLRHQYIDFMQEYLRLGHMKRIMEDSLDKPYYFLPHHCVLRPDSTTTKLRVVFDASAKTSTNISLNDILHTGPVLQEDVFSVLLRFRLPKFVFTADIEKMYRQVQVNQNDQRYQLIIWRNAPDEPLQYYQLTTVTYGMTAAPYLAIKCLQRLAKEEKEDRPLGAEAIQQHIYVDDVMAGSDRLQDAHEMKAQLTTILQSGGFHLKKWCSNHPKLLQDIPTEDRALQFQVEDQTSCHIKTLGLTWLPGADDFSIQTFQFKRKEVTKRTVSSDIAHLFDPLGIMSPVTIRAKIFLQTLWNLKLDWDAAPPLEFHTRWVKFREELQSLQTIKFPRHIFSGQTPKTIQMHVFSDASEKAYGAAIYVRSKQEDNTIIVRLLCAKSKVAPTKTTTLARLELQAATLAAKLSDRVRNDLKWHDIPCLYWTDSEIVLAWLHSSSSSLVTFVANRVASIQEITSVSQWRYVPSEHNVADIVSRGLSPVHLKGAITWFYGPRFLHGCETLWPEQPSKFETDLEKKRTKIVLLATGDVDFIATIDHRNSYIHLKRVLAYVLRFIKTTRSGKESRPQSRHLTVEELNEAHTIITRHTQSSAFKDDIASLERNNTVNGNSNLVPLHPFLDDKGVLRVGGRVEDAEISYEAKHPVLLPYKHPVTKLIMLELHISNSHIGPQGLLAITRQRFWPIKGKTIARSIVLSCIPCQRAKPKLTSQLMGNLPASRVRPARPFSTAGVDFCGPFFTHYRSRGKRPQKTYIAVFICFTTKAVHLEVVSELTTNAFIGALKRFVSRRGNCRHIYCDNATNFVGAANQLQEIKEVVYSEKAEESIVRFCTTKGIDFHFIPPRAPHFGGLWEAAVKSAKRLLPSNYHNIPLTYEELETSATEVEAILNSRPLTPMSSNPNDLTALTPGHFLIGEPLTSFADATSQPEQIGLHQHWKRLQYVKNQFWQRWVKEYLSELQYRHKWKQSSQNVEIGTMVILKEPNTPVLRWPLGRIVNTIKGKDGLVRVADIKTASGILRRPIHNLAPLFMQPDEEMNNAMDAETIHANEPEAGPSTSWNDQIEEQAVQEPQTNRQPGQKLRQNQLNTPPSNSKRARRHLTATMLHILLVCCLMLPLALSVNPHATVKPFQRDPGLYFERLGDAHLIANEWSLVIYYDLSNYRAGLHTIDQGIEQLSHICGKLRHNQSCSGILSQVRETFSKIQENNELLHTTHGTSTRQKRSPLDIVGNIANSLFGVLDSAYAQRMADTIQNLQGNEQRLLELLKNQTSVIDATTRLTKKSHQVIGKRMQELSGYLNKTLDFVNSLKTEEQQLRASEYFNTLSMQIILLITSYEQTQSSLLEALTDSHHGKINLLLLPPKQLYQQLTLIRDHLPSTLKLPGENYDLPRMYTLMTIECRALSNQIIFRINLPLFSYDQYDMLRIIPVPIATKTGFASIITVTKFLMINRHRDLYYPVSEAELSKCILTEQSNYICKQLHPLLRKGSHTCECQVAILTKSSPAPCTVTKFTQVPTWIQLAIPNHWIYTMKEQTNFNIACDSGVSSITLIGSGIINITRGCTLTGEFAMIQANNFYASSIETTYTSAKLLADALELVNQSTVSLHTLKSVDLTQDISSVQDDIKKLQTSERELHLATAQHLHHYSLGYTNLILILVVALYTARRFYRKTQKLGHTTAPTPAPRSRPQEPFQIDPALHV